MTPGSVGPNIGFARRRAAWLLGLLGAGWMPFMLLGSGVGLVVSANPHLNGTQAYFAGVGSFDGLVRLPLASLSAFVIVLTPGLIAALAVNRGRTLDEWLLYGFSLSLPLVSGAGMLVLAAGGTGSGSFLVAIGVVTAATFAWLWRSLARRGGAWPIDGVPAARHLVTTVVVLYALLVLLTPKLLWEDFNGDGAHAYEAARLLLWQVLPFWPADSGSVGAFPGLTSMLYAFPTSWFIRLFGEHEVSARLPYLLYLVPLHAALIALARHGCRDRVAAAARLVIWMVLVNFTLVVAFSTTYNPYSADIALPATQDTLAVLVFLGYVLASLERSWGWAALFAAFTLVSLPTGLIFLGLWFLALVLVWDAPRPFDRIVPAGLMLGGGLVALVLVPSILPLVGLPAPGQEYGAGQLVMRFAFLQFLELKRFLYVIVPAGLLPVVVFVWWRRLDAVARVFTFFTVAYFFFVYVQAYASLHYYLPAILFVLVPFWRLVPNLGAGQRTSVVGLSVAGAALGLWLVLPTHAGPVVAARQVGAAIDIRVPGYDRVGPAVFRASSLLGEVIAISWRPVVPESEFGTSPLVLNFYAHQTVESGRPKNYVLQPSAEPPPDNATLIGSDDEFSVFVYDEAAWQAHRSLRPPTPAGAPLLVASRGLLFRSEPLPEGFMMVDLPAIARRLGIDVEGVARRLGVGG